MSNPFDEESALAEDRTSKELGYSKYLAFADHTHPPPNVTWKNPSMEPGWATTAEIVKYCRQDNLLVIRGNASASAGRSANAMFYLPISYRPKYNSITPAICSIAGGGDILCRIQVQTTGLVLAYNLPLGSVIDYVTLNLLIFMR